MSFSYSALKSAEKSGDRVGNWKGYPVFACQKMNLDKKSEGAYFIVYDDDNYIVRRIGNQWYSFGQVSESGNVSEWDHKKKYNPVGYAYHYDTQAYEPAAHAVCGKSDADCNGTAAAATDEVVGDVKMGLDVEATLKAAREMTIDSLLEGFNYGLEAKG